MVYSPLLNPLFSEAGITPEMIDWYYKKINLHMELVKKYCKKIIETSLLSSKLLEVVAPFHDCSKFEEPEILPYIQLFWLKKTEGYKGYKKPGTLLDRQMYDVTMHHVRNNKHHPEYWDGRDIDFNSTEDRDAPAIGVIADGTKMPEVYIAEMVADWMAMAEELGNPTCIGWAKKNINKRWGFTFRQENLIYDLINGVQIDIQKE
jgi:hypothetical protein